MTEHHDHRDDCPFKFATLDVCDCVEKNMLDRIEALTNLNEALVELMDDRDAKLAKAVEALDEAVYLLKPDEKDMMRQAGVYRIVTTLAEIKGESHD